MVTQEEKLLNLETEIRYLKLGVVNSALALFKYMMHQEECGQQDKGGSPSPLHCPGEASSGVLCPVVGSPVQEG